MVWLYGIECRCRVGVPAAERRRPQKILVDVGLETGIERAAAKDDFRLAVDYQAVERTVRAAAEAGERALIETLAERLAQVVLALDRRLRAVHISIRKRPRVMPKTREVVVSIVRRRPS